VQTVIGLSQALALIEQGQFEAARDALKAAAQQHSSSARLHFLLGNVQNMLQQPALALQSYQTALTLDSQLPGLHNNLGNTWLDVGQPEKALQSFDAALLLKPQDANALNNRGTALRDLKCPEEARKSYEQALALSPQHLDALNNLANLLVELNQPERALAQLRIANSVRPQFAPTLRNSGRALQVMRRSAEALAYFDQALRLNAQDAFTWMYRAEALRDLQRIEEAIDSYGQALRLHPQLDFVAGLKLYLQMQICRWDHFEQELTQLQAALHAKQRYTVPMPLLALLNDPALQKIAAEIYAQAHAPAPTPAPAQVSEEISPHAFTELTKNSPRKIKLGYFSAHFHQHPTGRLMAQVIEWHDRSQFEVIAFSFGMDAQDSVRQRLVKAFDEFMDVRSFSDAQVLELVRNKGIDIAIDLAGYYDQSRPALLARRVAPLQVSYLITPGTLGMPWIDYLLADPVVVPTEAFEHYCEHIVHLPNSYFTYDSTQAISSQAFTRADLGLPEDAFVFCCFNSVYKILPATFDIWMRLLQSAPHSVMWLLESHPSARDNLKTQAKQRGIDPARLIFSKVAPIAEHLARHQLADLFLDTWPYNAHTTACDALYSGLPVLTCPGQTFASRVAASLLTALNLPELIAPSPQAYEAMALEYVKQPNRLNHIRQQLIQLRRNSPLFQGAAKTRDLESAYRIMLDRHRSGRPSAHFIVPA
jgi:predicted O-linked N-acetylglucosamine transferase (SPINDLY family)